MLFSQGCSFGSERMQSVSKLHAADYLEVGQLLALSLVDLPMSNWCGD